MRRREPTRARKGKRRLSGSSLRRAALRGGVHERASSASASTRSARHGIWPRSIRQSKNRVTREISQSRSASGLFQSKRDVTAASHYAAIACEPALVHFQGSSSSIFVFG